MRNWRGAGMVVALLLGGRVAHGTTASATAAEGPAACAAGTALIAEYRALYGAEITFRHLIVLIPDPVALRGRDAFDAVFTGVEEAFGRRIQDSRYVRDRQWFPWTDAPAAARCWEGEPGVAIYRSTGSAGPILALFVGETPTWGLRAVQMRRALQLADTHAPPTPTPPVRYHILGPSFSGTAASLAAILEPQPGAAAIISGTVTNPGAVAQLGRAVVKKGSYFTSVAPGDAELLDALAAFFQERGGVCRSPDHDGNMALFTESGTTYGLEQHHCFRIIKFPPDLESVRKAYEANGAGPDKNLPLTRAPGAGPTVHTALAVGGALRTLGGRGVRFVGIMATDAEDVVFMARRIREQLPDVRLFTLGADLRYLHEKNARDLNGMIVAHAGPAPLGQLGSSVLASELVFHVYLAARSLLDGKVPDTRGVRISFVGNGALWRLAPAGRGWSPPAPTSWSLVLAACVLAFLAVAGTIWISGRAVVARPGRAWALLRPCVHDDLADDDRLLLGMLLMVTACPVALLLAASSRAGVFDLGLALVCAAAMLAVPWRYLRRHPRKLNGGALALCVAAACSATLALSLGCGPERQATFHLTSGGSPVLVALMGLAGFAIALWCSHARLRMLDTHRFEGRTRSGPRFEDLPPPIATAIGEGGAPAHGVFAAERQLLNTLKDPWRHNVFARAGYVGAVILAALPFVFKIPQTFEPHWRNAVLVLVGVLATLPALGGLARLLVTWHRTMGLLRRLAPCPSVAALPRVPKPLSRPLEAQLVYAVYSDVELELPVAALRRLAEQEPKLQPAVAECEAHLCAMRAAQVQGKSSDVRRQLVAHLLEISGGMMAKRDPGTPQAALIDDLAATLVAIFIPRYVRHFRVIAPQLIVSGVAGILMTSLYFAQPQRFIATVVFIWTVVTVAAVLWCYLSLARDPVLGAIGGASGKSERWPVVKRVVRWMLLPAASLVPVHFPEVSLWVTQLLTGVVKGFE